MALSPCSHYGNKEQHPGLSGASVSQKLFEKGIMFLFDRGDFADHNF